MSGILQIMRPFEDDNFGSANNSVDNSQTDGSQTDPIPIAPTGLHIVLSSDNHESEKM